ncbi:MAG: SDR family NAD(P)-dependent oxidoreductase, partial [Acidimicrobiales bacterium]
VTGASLGLGAALAAGLARDGWSLVIDGRHAADLHHQATRLRAALTGPGATVADVVGDVADPAHRQVLAAAVRAHGHVDLVLNNASVLGPSPQPALVDYPLDALRAVYEVNTFAPLALLQDLTPWLRVSGEPRVVNITSDAAVEAYPQWGGYGSSKAALEQLTATWAAEQPWCRAWAVDPGDLRTRLHQQAFPGEDISDRPEPESVVPALLSLLASGRPSGRVRLADIAVSFPAGIR